MPENLVLFEVEEQIATITLNLKCGWPLKMPPIRLK